MASFKESFKNAGAYVGRLTPSQVMMLLGVAAGIVVGTIFVIGWVDGVTYARLYSDLEESEAGEVIAYLTDNNIPYKLSDGGRSISVPSDQVYKTRISLASEGLPRSGNIGYSIFDKNNFGMTDFLLDLNYRRALEGELTRTIMQLSEIQAARVHIVIPKDRLFKEAQKEATASVVLKLKHGSALSGRQIAGITHLIASSVEGLRPDKITIVDYEGNLLTSGQSSDPLAGLSTSQLQVRQQVEQYLEGKAQTMLDNVLGRGKSVIRVTAELNFQQLEKTSETYDPNSLAVRSEERLKSSNTTTDKSTETNESQEEGNSETIVTNYEVSKTVEHIINAVGTIERLSVAVLVDGVYAPPENAEEKAESVYQPRSPEELDRLAAIVKNAVGFDQQRSDQIEVVNIGFDRRELVQEQEQLDTMYQRDFYLEIARKVGLVLLIALAVLFLRGKIKRLFAALGKMAPAPRTAPPTLADEQSEESADAPRRIRPQRRQPRLVDEMQDAAKGQPEELARVIKTMMIE